MGLAEPRKRLKLSHDPRNTSWTNSTDSYGQRLMQRQGWKAGEALGAQGTGSNYAETEAAKVKVKYKDDMLGLGASLKSRDIANQKTGFDAFQGLLGRLNAKTVEEVQVVEKKLEDKKLAMFAQSRWGGMVFVPGGILVQSDPYKQIQALKDAEKKDSQSSQAPEPMNSSSSSDEATMKSQRKAEKKQRREAKRLRKESKLLKRQAKSESSSTGLATPDPSSSNEADKSATKKRSLTPDTDTIQKRPKIEAKPAVRNGRQLLRGKNILAKRMAFSDMKGLDGIFMKVG